MAKNTRVRNYNDEKANGQQELFHGLSIVREERQRDVYDILHLAQVFAFCSLPYRPSDNRQISHTVRLGDGSKVEVIFTALRPGVPIAFGHDRSLLHWLIDRAIRQQSAFIAWEYASDYLKAMGQHESGRNRELLRQRFERISSTGITVIRTTDTKEQLNIPIIRRSVLPCSIAGGERVPGIAKKGKVLGVQFDELFVADFMSHRIPILRSLLMATQARPQMQDCMLWLIWRSYAAANESCIGWDALREQFWQSDSNQSRIRQRFREAIILLRTAWPELQASANFNGLRIGPPKGGQQFLPNLRAPRHIAQREKENEDASIEKRELEREADIKRREACLMERIIQSSSNMRGKSVKTLTQLRLKDLDA